MAAPISPMQLLVSIVERGKGRCLLDHYRQFGLIHHNQAAGHGTAASHLLVPWVWDQRAGMWSLPWDPGTRYDS